MAAPSGTAASPDKFNPFTIHSTSYKTVNKHPIGVDVLFPKNLKPGKHPLIVRFHGGFLASVTGSSLFPWFFTNWILALATAHSAIIVSADYRLLPEATGQDILTDIADLWTWIHNDLRPYLSTVSPSPTLEADLSRILVAGDSAGAYLAIQSAITQPAGSIKTLVGLYPQLDMRSAFYTTKYEKSIFGMPMLPTDLVDKHIAATEPGTVVTSAIPPSRIDLACAMVQNGRMLEFLGDDRVLFPVEMVKEVESMPPTLILHGRDDSAVPVEGSERFVEAFKGKHPETPVWLNVQPGDHGFDGEATLETEWLREDVAFVVEHWLG
ncbi:hypothetical protein MMC30_009002 [Trapelia coarctata]|nr:hypothetical protein [Trapelia coarctata]